MRREKTPALDCWFVYWLYRYPGERRRTMIPGEQFPNFLGVQQLEQADAPPLALLLVIAEQVTGQRHVPLEVRGVLHEEHQELGASII